MEEDIKILEEFKKNGYLMLMMKYGDRHKANLKIERALENIIKRYKELDEYYKEQNEVNAKFILKSKIEEKMKELEKEKGYYYSEEKIEELNDKIRVLEDLLESEENK